MRKKLKIVTIARFALLGLIIGVLNACSGQNGGNEDTLVINGTEIYYQTMGSGEPVIIVHGGPVLDHSYMEPYFRKLADQYKLVFYDQRLSGRSSADVEPSEVTMQNLIDDIEALRKSLSLGKVHVVGHSWGGLLAMKYAISYPGNLRKLVLANPMPASAELWQKEEIVLARRKTAADRKAREKILNSDGYKKKTPAAIEKLLRLSFRNQFHDSTLADSLDFYIPEDYTRRSRLFGNLMGELQSYDLFPELAEVQVPTLLIYGADEPAVELSGKKLNDTIPNSKMKVIEKSGHFPFIEQPKLFLNEVRIFLEK